MCGVKTSQFGMGYLEADGTYTGLDIEYCKAVAAAIGLDPATDIEYVLATGSNRFELLASEEIDVLIRTTTWTTSRDADLNADFAGINFYDGQGILVNLDAYTDENGTGAPTSALELTEQRYVSESVPRLKETLQTTSQLITWSTPQ